MLKKIFYFGIGLTSYFFEYFDRLARTGEDRYNELVGANHQEDEVIAVETVVAVEAEAQVAQVTVEEPQQDDLTVIDGIGPTFASRLQEAGVTTYEELASLSVEQIREITRVAEWQADPSQWKASAAALA